MTHARLAPSAAEQWGPGRCAGSVSMQERYPVDGDTDESRLGTAAHFIATEMLEGRDADFAPNGVPIDDEMRLHAAHFVEAAAGSQWVEQRVSMARLHPECFGTPDAVRFDEEARTLAVIDYKYGHGYVDEHLNYQMVLYAMGALWELLVGEADWDGWQIELTIVQPRYYRAAAVRTSKMTGGQLRGTWLPKFQEAAASASNPGALCKTGPWCKHCTALLHCGAAYANLAAVADIVDSQQCAEVTPESIGFELTLVERLDQVVTARRKALEAQAQTMDRIAGWQKERKFSDLRWSKPAAEVIELGDLLGVDLRKPAEPITPTQAKKHIDAGIVGEYASRVPTGFKFVRATDASKLLGDKP